MKYGFRSEDIYGSGVRDLRDAINYEICDLGNNDILCTLLDTPFFANVLSSDELLQIEPFYEIDSYDDISDTYARHAVEICMGIIRRKYPNAKYALWLCDTPDEVWDFYGKGYDIDKYPIFNEMPISVLGEEGRLYVYDDMPIPADSGF